jgi:hypothetical protein
MKWLWRLSKGEFIMVCLWRREEAGEESAVVIRRLRLSLVPP